MKRVLSIAGSDCSGGAGIQADLKTFSAHGVYGMSVIVSVVAENTGRVISIQNISPDMIGRQIDAVFEDIVVDAVKVGMLSTPECMDEVVKKLNYYHPANIVIDPVMYAKNGCPLMEPAAIKTLIGTVIPLADVLTPNIPEAEKIAGGSIKSVADMEEAEKAIYTMGYRAVVVKGGHASGNAVDVLHGVSVGGPEEAIDAVNAGADYLGVGAMFPTSTKPDAEFVSMEELEKIRSAVAIPIVVIGGINRENAKLFKDMGIDGLAVVSEVIAQPDIEKAAEDLKSIFLGKGAIHAAGQIPKNI